MTIKYKVAGSNFLAKTNYKYLPVNSNSKLSLIFKSLKFLFFFKKEDKPIAMGFFFVALIGLK